MIDSLYDPYHQDTFCLKKPGALCYLKQTSRSPQYTMPMDLHSLIARNRPPPLFYPALYLFNLFPLHAPLTLWGMDAPYGRFGQGGEGSWLYMNGMCGHCMTPSWEIIIVSG